tara:strand:+ start:306 stop:482 length:177 start_codon:yes stop_codon:yes gene_type:complete
MNITNAKYVNDSITDERTGVSATIDGQVWWVPMENSSPFYREILRQVEAGELTIADAD